MRVDGSRILNPGLLRHQITIQSPTKTQNSYGEDVISWTDWQVCYARIEALQGRELEAARQTWAEARYKITTQYIPGVNREYRIYVQESGLTLDILDVADAAGTRMALRYYAKDYTD